MTNLLQDLKHLAQSLEQEAAALVNLPLDDYDLGSGNGMTEAAAQIYELISRYGEVEL